MRGRAGAGGGARVRPEGGVVGVRGARRRPAEGSWRGQSGTGERVTMEKPAGPGVGEGAGS